MMTGLWHDTRYALRRLRGSKGFSSVTILLLALAIGANTSIFTLVNAVILRDLPYKNPTRLVRVYQDSPQRNVKFGPASPLDFEDWRKQSTSFSALGAYFPYR